MELSRAVGTTDRLWLFRASLMGAADAARAEECVASIGPAGHGLRHPIPLVMKGRNRSDDAQIWHFAVNGTSPHVTRGLLRLLCGLFPVCLARLHFLVARRQLADWRWPRAFHSTSPPRHERLLFPTHPPKMRGKSRETWPAMLPHGLSLSTLPEMTRETTPLHPQLHLSMTPSSSSPVLQRIISRHQPLRGSKPLGLSQRKGTPPSSAPCLDSTSLPDVEFAAPADCGVLFPPRCQLLHRIFSPFFSFKFLLPSIVSACSLLPTAAPPPPPQQASPLSSTTGDPVLYVYAVTRSAGLFRSLDGGSGWALGTAKSTDDRPHKKSYPRHSPRPLSSVQKRPSSRRGQLDVVVVIL